MADGAFTNTATINSTTIGDPDRSNNSSQVNTTVDPVADVQLQAKTVSPNPVRAGVDTTYVITYRKRGTVERAKRHSDGSIQSDRGRRGYTIGTLASSKGTCSFNAGSNLISCTVGTLAANEVETLTFTARPTWMGLRRRHHVCWPIPPQWQRRPLTRDPSNDSKSASLTINGRAGRPDRQYFRRLEFRGSHGRSAGLGRCHHLKQPDHVCREGDQYRPFGGDIGHFPEHLHAAGGAVGDLPLRFQRPVFVYGRLDVLGVRLRRSRGPRWW